MIVRVVDVKYGAPILKLHYSTLRGLSIFLYLVSVSAVAYLLFVLHFATETSLNLGVYIDLVSSDGYRLPLYIALPTLYCICLDVVQMPVVYRAFQNYKPHNSLNTYLMLVFVFHIIGVVLFVFFTSMVMGVAYDDSEDIRDGILDAMQNYSQDSLIKMSIDRLQIKLQCCGSKTYTEWYNITWYDENLIQKDAGKIVGQTPFSCCSIKSLYPCIHHGIVSGISDHYYYKMDTNLSVTTHGCHDAILKAKLRTGWNIIWRFFISIMFQCALLILLRLIQTARFEREKFDKETHIYTSWILGCYGGYHKVNKSAPPPPPIPPEMAEIRRLRALGETDE